MNYKVFLANFYEGFSNLYSTKQRSFLGLLGVVIGTASVIMLVNIAGMVERQILSQFKNMGTNVFTVSVDLDQEEHHSGFALKLLPEAVKNVAHLNVLIPCQSQYININFSGMGHNYYGVVATVPQFFEILNIRPKQGRLLSKFDSVEPYTVVGHRVHTTSHVKLGKIIHMARNGFEVVGINHAILPNLLLNFDPNYTFFINLKSAQSLVEKFKVTFLLGVAESDVWVDSVTQKLQAYFKRIHSKQHITIRTAKTLINQAKKQAHLLTILLASIGSIALIVGGIGVMNVMLVSIAQRRSEIGLRIALGATRSNIRLLFLSEAMMLCFIGGILGTIFGLLVSFIFATELGLPFAVTWIALPTGVIISVVSGILSGVYPAAQAAKLNPIEALRTE